ncbi:DEAD/DEAH box helicase [Bacillus toyonensis]|uniref:DEAD/DEAH box helicase n=1 Tax=Bacillus toyonensis TaxID=155322 RepID=UPI0038262984
MEKNYISNIIEEKGFSKGDLFNDNHYSVIAGGVGTGKSTFTTKGLAKLLKCKSGEILMTAPLSAITNQLVAKGIVDKKTGKELLETGFFQMNNVTVCTYAALKNAIEGRTELPTQIKYVVFDEAHQLITAETYAKHGSFFFKWLNETNIQALFLTATPKPLLTYKHSKKPFKEILRVKSNVQVGNIYFTTETDLLNHVKYFANRGADKIFIAVQTVTEAKNTEKQINSILPGSAKAIFSRYHEKATEEMIDIADKVIQTEQFPEGVKFLIVNGAYTEGMELQTKCDTAVVKQHSVDAIVQAVGRLRKGVNEVVVVLSRSRFFAQDKNLFDEFDNFLRAYHAEKNEIEKREMLMYMLAIQEETYGHKFVIVDGEKKKYKPDYRINRPLYHNLQIKLNDAYELYCEDDEISDEKFDELENTFKPYFPDTEFYVMREKGAVSKKEQFNVELVEFLEDIVGEIVYAEPSQDGIDVTSMCRKVMQLRKKYNLNFEKPVTKLKELNTIIKPYGFNIGGRSSKRIKKDVPPIKIYKLQYCTISN